MSESILFAPWQDADMTPEVCPLCKEQLPIFEYQITPIERSAEQSQHLAGYCCLRCGQQLLATLEERTLTEWDEEVLPERYRKKAFD